MFERARGFGGGEFDVTDLVAEAEDGLLAGLYLDLDVAEKDRMSLDFWEPRTSRIRTVVWEFVSWASEVVRIRGICAGVASMRRASWAKSRVGMIRIIISRCRKVGDGVCRVQSEK